MTSEEDKVGEMRNKKEIKMGDIIFAFGTSESFKCLILANDR